VDYKTAYKLVNHAQAKSKDEPKPSLQIPHIDTTNNRMFAADGFRLVVVGLDAKPEPPNYVHLIPKDYLAQISVNPHELYDVAMLHNSIKSHNHPLRISLIDADKPTLALSQSGYRIQSTINCAIIDDKRTKPTKVRFAIAPKYLMECAKAITEYLKPPKRIKRALPPSPTKSEETCIVLSISTPMSPLLFQCKDYQEVIMPMFVQWDQDEGGADES
jgi:DNA polymerase III sliding clamp (beta) subunit (PCNA family)